MKSYISRKLPLETRTTDQIFVFRSSEKLIRFRLCFRSSCLVRRTNRKKAYDHAIAELRRATELSLSGPPALAALAALARTFAVSGRITEARILLEQLQQSKRQYVAPFYVAIVYAGLGENERALDWLEKPYADHSNAIVFLKVDPQLDTLRSNPRFHELQRRLRLPD